MTLIIDRDFSKREDTDSVLDNVKMALLCQRGKFYPNKDYGSKINGRDINELIAEAVYASQGIDGVYIKSAQIVDNELVVIVLINDVERSVSIAIE